MVNEMKLPEIAEKTYPNDVKVYSVNISIMQEKIDTINVSVYYGNQLENGDFDVFTYKDGSTVRPFINGSVEQLLLGSKAFLSDDEILALSEDIQSNVSSINNVINNLLNIAVTKNPKLLEDLPYR